MPDSTSALPELAIDVRGLTKTYAASKKMPAKQALKGVDLAVPRGSIFGLLGSTMLLGMHGATIVATARYGSELELDEIEVEGSGTHRAQLFWRWVMGFNANADSIHVWAFWFAILCVVAGAIGLLLSGTVIKDWFTWAQSVHIVAPADAAADWSQFVQ